MLIYWVGSNRPSLPYIRTRSLKNSTSSPFISRNLLQTLEAVQLVNQNRPDFVLLYKDWLSWVLYVAELQCELHAGVSC